jgi:phosphate uptake regulator
MRRKLVKQGVATMMVSLPSKWVKQHHLGKGDEIEILEEDSSLVITTPKKGEKALRKEVRIPTPSEYKNRLIDVPYMQGYDEIVVFFDDAKVMEMVIKETERLLGLEVVRQTETSCTIKNVAEALEEEFETILRRTFLVVKGMADDSIEAIKEKDYQRLKNIGDLEKMVHKYALFCMRMINKYGYKNEKEAHFVFYISYILEQIADHIEDVCIHVAEKKEKVDPKIFAFFKDIVKLIDQYYQVFYKREWHKVLETDAFRKKLQQKTKSLLESKKNVFLLHHMIFILEKVTHLSYFLN